MKTPSRRGSALLIVLGMIAFMVVSAVAFSAYMRYSRIPSSFLRQTDASRLLAKAALANAIDEIDAAIGNNAHPGVGMNAYKYPRHDGDSHDRNTWIGRVYMGTNVTTASSTEDNTVSTLSLEGLAYLPPPLVNEVRYYSRRTRSAEWHRMNFDAGRYAFCAVDVSDYFDVNSVDADVPRSSDPESRVSLAYVFEAADHSASGGGLLGSAAQWDSFMAAFRGGTKLPLVSLADWNLAMNNGGPFVTPFCNYVKTAPGNFYNITSETGDDADKIRLMTFVTDSYFPPVARVGNQVYDLSDDNYQPWSDAQLRTWSASACETVANGTSKCLLRLAEHVPYAVSAALFDYLDRDSVPCSLALPTVERTPMVCGIEVTFDGASLAVKDTVDESERYKYDPTDYTKQNTRTTTKTIRYNIDGSKLNLATINVGALVTYPFRHGDGVGSDGFKVDGALMLYLTSEDMGLRPGDACDRLRALDENNFSTASVKDGVIILPLSASEKPSFKSDMKSEADAVKSISLQVKPGSVASDLLKTDHALFSAVVTCTQTAPGDEENGYDWNNPSPTNDGIDDSDQASVTSAECKFQPLKDNGAVDAAYQATAANLFKKYRTGGADLKLNAAVIVRVLNESGKVVDMVPACLACDETFNRTQNGSGLAADAIRAVGGDGTPLLRLDTGVTFKWGRQGFADAAKTPATITITPAAAIVGDPRFNYAPEHWWKYEGELSPENWLKDCGARDSGENGADGDIFMQVSDQCRLQSVYELANLPRIGENGLDKPGSDTYRGAMKEPAVTRKSIGAKDEALNRAYMWKTYDPFGRYKDRNADDDGFAALRISSGFDGYRVCPYSDCTNVLMAALANTPHDWRCASSDNEEISADTAAAFNGKYAWNGYSSGAQLDWEDLGEVAGALMEEVRTNPVGNDDEDPWEVAFRNLGWRTAANGTGSEKYILDGLDLADDCKVFNTDRKFLYGFWHDCFSARQQLFLIFFRAEPAMMGGGLIRQTPPQLGARGVALVWRDPAVPKQNGAEIANAPHRTRILFYRQFD